MLTGWVAYLLAWVSTALFYKTHPSSVESGTEHKLFLYVFGKKKFLRGYKGERDGGELNQTLLSFQSSPTKQKLRRRKRRRQAA